MPAVQRATTRRITSRSSARRTSNTSLASSSVGRATVAVRLRPRLDQPLELEPRQRRADERPAHAELAPIDVLGQLGARRQRLLDDRLASAPDRRCRRASEVVVMRSLGEAARVRHRKFMYTRLAENKYPP